MYQYIAVKPAFFFGRLTPKKVSLSLAQTSSPTPTHRIFDTAIPFYPMCPSFLPWYHFIRCPLSPHPSCLLNTLTAMTLTLLPSTHCFPPLLLE